MESSHTRPSWQRKFNCHLINEDMPEVSFSPSTSSSVSESSWIPSYTTSPSDNSIQSSVPKGQKHNLPHETKWWLHPQPDLGQQPNMLEAELLVLGSDAKFSKNRDLHEELDFQSLFQHPSKICRDVMKNDVHGRPLETKAALNSDPCGTAKKEDVHEVWYSNHNFVDGDPMHSLETEDMQKLCDTESPWTGTEKTEPWWRSATKDELASFVAQKSVEHIENCDLPRPQKKLMREQPSEYVEFENNEELETSSTGMKKERGLCNLSCTMKVTSSLGTDDKDFSMSSSSCIMHGLSSQFSDNYHGAFEDERQTKRASEDDQSKSQLLEALCHSQTRARQAEEAAQQAYSEKEHILALFFRQASQLFAYRQWFQLLQLESFYLELKKGNSQTGLFPGILPWFACEGSQGKKPLHKLGKRNCRSPRWWVGKSAVAIAIGLGLAGAGFLLGWTMSWLSSDTLS